MSERFSEFVENEVEVIKLIAAGAQLPVRDVIRVLEMHDEPHRFYHDYWHPYYLCQKILNDSYGKQKTQELLLTALFHDCVYDPKWNTYAGDFRISNERASAKEWKRTAEIYFDSFTNDIGDRVYNNIIDTEKHIPRSETSQLFCIYDLSGFAGSFENVVRNELNFQKEYSYVDWAIYKLHKLKMLDEFAEYDIIKNYIAGAVENIHKVKEWLALYQPKIAVYAGSFYPFHKGHLNVLQKAEAVFDKVIVAYGKNPEKAVRTSIPNYLNYHQVDEYSSTLVEYVRGKQYPVTIVRGLRNTTDMQFELNQYRWLQAVMPEIRVVSIFCDKEYEHISSSAIRTMQGYSDYYDTVLEYTVK